MQELTSQLGLRTMTRGSPGFRAQLQKAGVQRHLNFGAGPFKTSGLIQHTTGDLTCTSLCPSQLALTPLGGNAITTLLSNWQRGATQKEVGGSVAVLPKQEKASLED